MSRRWKMITFGASLLSSNEKGWWVAVGRSAVLLDTNWSNVPVIAVALRVISGVPEVLIK